MKKLIRLLFHRVTVASCLLLLQLAALVFALWRFSQYFVYIYSYSIVFSLVLLLIILNDDTVKSGYKPIWILLIMVVPLFGSLFYVFWAVNRYNRRKMKHHHDIGAELIRQNKAFAKDGRESVLEEIKSKDARAGVQASYIEAYAKSPPCRNTETRYFETGETYFEALIQALKKAERFIFIESFIIREGVMWNAILDILTEKVKQGLDVRVIYDDFGCIFHLPKKYDRKLRKLGIKCSIFGPITPILSMKLNTRDHRKIIVIDGTVGFTGGINLADEYVNEYQRFGHWKDAGIMLKGDGVWGLTQMFLSIWRYLTGQTEDYTAFLSPVRKKETKRLVRGYVQPYGDTPADGEMVGEIVYLNLISKAERYVYIYTPYLIMDAEMTTALSVAAKSGVDVRIITPYIADKRYVHAVTRSYYETLVRAGVKIYEYMPGFIHAKAIVADGLYGTVGTVNLDYRSLYMHLECGVFMYDTDSLLDLSRDFERTLSDCKPIRLEEILRTSLYIRLFRMLLRLFAPML